MCHYEKGSQTEFPHMGNVELFCGVCRHPREATYKVSVLLHFFPTNHDFQLSAPGLQSQRFRADVESVGLSNIFLAYNIYCVSQTIV